jgi:N-acetylneuraminic acid mutarotase
MVHHNGKFYVYGGQGDITNALMEIDTNTWKVTYKKTILSEILESHTAQIYDSKMIIYGGYTSNSINENLLIYNTENSSWSKIPINGPPNRSSHTSTVIDNNMYVFGGRNEYGVRLNDLWILNLLNYKWESVITEYIPKVFNLLGEIRAHCS